MVTKITNLNTERTAEQEKNVWLEVLSHRNKLLLNSDWTQMSDSGLTETCINQWKTWRQQLKNVNRRNFSEPAQAEYAISILAKRVPFNDYQEVRVEPDQELMSLEEYKKQLMGYLDTVFNANIYSGFLDNPYLVEEQFKEAVDYLNLSGNGSYPLISVTAELYGMSENAVANEFVSRKVVLTKRLANMKQKYFHFQTLVKDASDAVQLGEIKSEIKEWILTLT